MLVDLVQMNPPYSVHRLKQPIIIVLTNTLWTSLADLTLKIKNNQKVNNDDKNLVFIRKILGNICHKVFEVRCESMN